MKRALTRSSAGGAPPPAIALDFSGRRPAPGWLGWLACLVGLLLAAATVSDYLALEQDLAYAQERQHQAERAAELAQRRAGVRDATPVPAEDVLRAGRIARELNRDWPGLLADLETAGNEDVALIGFDPQPAKASMRVSGYARSLKALFDYAARLGGQPRFAGARVDTYEFQQIDGINAVSFTLTAQWREVQ